MQLNPLSPSKTISNRNILLKNIDSEAHTNFDKRLTALLTKVADKQREGKQETDLRDFLNDGLYADYYINKKDTIDWAIHHGPTGKEKVAVILEVKSTTATTEMMTTDKPNAKALHELVLYYLRERIDNANHDIKHLIATNIHTWFVIDENWFDKNIFTTQLKKAYHDWKVAKKDTDHFYKFIAKPYLEVLETPLTCTFVDIKTLTETESRALFTLLSPEFLMKQAVANDTNKLNVPFYNELLHLMGIEERKDDKSNKKIIDRIARAELRNAGSLLENTIHQLLKADYQAKVQNIEQYGDDAEEQLFSVALELCITWLNRLLFLKLLEGQLVRYHNGDRNYRFLSSDKITDYDELGELFFDVLAEQPENRAKEVQEKFGNIPYLNSSLFEPSVLERSVLKVVELKDRLEIPFAAQTVLQDETGKTRRGKAKTLTYLLDFLGAYNFGSSDDANDKGIINAAVLGLIFEKLNGYKDGSFFTPSFITMYMCRQSIRRAVVAKLSEANTVDGAKPSLESHRRTAMASLRLTDFAAITEHLDYMNPEVRKEVNNAINSIKICDPAVGSGHFLVSALNELIAVKYDLKILTYRHSGQRVDKDWTIKVINDELVITDRETDRPFQYNYKNPDSQALQETLFEEKRTLIENCLFGVDINPKSVSICQLRLWIELLKNAYYKNPQPQQGEAIKTPLLGGGGLLQTLPNIDINIKAGNSLVSRFGMRSLSASTKQADERIQLNYTLKHYRENVMLYKATNQKILKNKAITEIKRLKESFKGLATTNDEDYLALKSKQAELEVIRGNFNYNDLQTLITGETPEEQRKKLGEKLDILAKKVVELESKWNDKLRYFYGTAFEWAFEFPEIVNEDGQFLGFDIVLANPPYIRQEELAEYKKYFQKNFGRTYAGTADLCIFFVEQAQNILRRGGQFSFILPNKWMRAGYGENLRKMLKMVQMTEIVDFGDLPVFDEATAYPCILSFVADYPQENKLGFVATNVQTLDLPKGLEKFVSDNQFEVNIGKLSDSGWNLINPNSQNLLEKIIKKGEPLKNYLRNEEAYYGIKTGLTEAFMIDAATRQRLIDEDPNSDNIIKPMLQGRDVKPYQTPTVEKYLIVFGKGFTNLFKGKIEPEIWIMNEYPAIYNYLLPFKDKAILRTDKGDYWWELRACDYYPQFDKPKIMYQKFQVKPCFIFDEQGLYCNDSMWIIPTEDKYLFGLLNSRMGWYLISQYCTAIQNGYQLIYKYLSQIPIARPTIAQYQAIVAQVEAILLAKKGGERSEAIALVGQSHGDGFAEAEIDRLVYELYDLTEAEIEIIEKS